MSKQRNKTGLLKVTIVREGIGDFQLAHDQERTAVGQAPFFVGRLFVERQRILKLQAGLWHYSAIRICSYGANQIYNSLP